MHAMVHERQVQIFVLCRDELNFAKKQSDLNSNYTEEYIDNMLESLANHIRGFCGKTFPNDQSALQWAKILSIS